MSRVQKKSIENARVKLSCCHTSENTVHCRFLHVAETVEKNASHNAVEVKISQGACSYIYSICTNKKKVFKMRA